MTDVSDAAEPDEDDLGHRFPGRPSELRTIGDDDLFRELRRMAYANRWAYDRMAEHEMNARLILAVKSFKDAADRSARTLNVLTFVLVVLTVVLVVDAVLRAG